MECNILKELAVFDPNAPINVSISFDDDDESDEMTIKSENVTDDYDNQSKDLLPDTYLNLKVELKEEPISTCETVEEVKTGTQIDQNIIQKDTSLPHEHLQNNILNSNDSRKRKITELNIYKNKKRSSQSSTSEPNNQTSPVNDSENMCERSQAETSPILILNQSNSTSAAGQLNVSKNGNENQVQTDKLSSYIKRCLLPVSEHMRLIIEAYSYHKQHKTPKDDFSTLKRKLFNLSYSTVVAMLLPEEKNVDFIKTFLKETHRHAFETSSMHKGSFKDYETLLRELLSWTKHNKNIIDRATSKKDRVLKPWPNIENMNSQELNKILEQNPSSNITEKSKNTDQDKICIFSGGFQGNEISINVDTSLQKYIQNINSPNNLEKNQPSNRSEISAKSPNPSNTYDKTELIKCLTKSPIKFKNSNQDVLNQPTGQPIMPNSSNTTLLNYPSQRDSALNNPYGNVNLSSSEPLTQIQQLTLQQSLQALSQETLQQYGLSMEVPQQCKQPTHASPQYVPTHQAPQYKPTHQSQSQSHYWQSQLGQPLHKQSNRVVSSGIWQPSLTTSQYGQQRQHQGYNPPSNEQMHKQRQFVQQQQQQHLLRQYSPSQNVSQPMNSKYGKANHIPPQHSPVQHVLPQYRQAQSGQLQNVLPQYQQTQLVYLHPENPTSTEWQQSNVLQYQKQAQTGVLTHSNSLRTVSTDSGFISPLNFGSSEQTAPDPRHAPSEGNETANLLITHVTSLNPKVCFVQEDICVVCKTSTKQVCMGCMKRYYCSYDCQLIDWSNHEPSCKRVTT